MERVVSAALVTGAQAIHPGYGFLSENAAFARLCQDNNLTFIGPTPEIMELLSDKQQAKAAMERAGVPVIPGTRIVPDVPRRPPGGRGGGIPHHAQGPGWRRADGASAWSRSPETWSLPSR